MTKNFFNLHIIETESEKWKFSVMIQDKLVITDGVLHKTLEETIKAMIETTEILNKFIILDSIEKIKKWEC